MEEISWAQRIRGFHTPAALQRLNVQHEASLPNLLPRYPLHALYILAYTLAYILAYILAYTLAGLYGACARFLIPPPYGAGIASGWRDWRLPVLVLYFLPLCLLYAYDDHLRPYLIERLGPALGCGRGIASAARTRSPASCY